MTAREKMEARRRLAEEDAARQRDEDLRNVMGTAAGRRFVWRLIDEHAGTFGGSFSSDALTTAFNEGRRSVGRELMTEAQRLATSAYMDMLREHLDAQHMELELRTEEEAAAAAED